MNKIIVAIDGYSSCGKSTLAKKIAEEFSYIYIDTGAMYRAVALYFMRKGVLEGGKVDMRKVPGILDQIDVSFHHNRESNVSETLLNGENVEQEIRGMEVSENVSKVSLIKEVRAKMVQLQRKIGEDKGIVMDGRDIGTVVFPHAELKIFMTADPEVRAQRRYKELKEKGKGIKITLEEVRENLRARDHQDTTRKENPLKKADDAVVIDNTDMSITEQNSKVIELVRKRIKTAQ